MQIFDHFFQIVVQMIRKLFLLVFWGVEHDPGMLPHVSCTLEFRTEMHFLLGNPNFTPKKGQAQAFGIILHKKWIAASCSAPSKTVV